MNLPANQAGQSTVVSRGFLQALRSLRLWVRRGIEEVLMAGDAGRDLFQRFQQEWHQSPLRVISSILAGPDSYPLVWANIIFTLGGIILGLFGCPIFWVILIWLAAIGATVKLWLAMKIREVEFGSLALVGLAGYELALKPGLAIGNNIAAFLDDKKNDIVIPLADFFLSLIPLIISKEERDSIIKRLEQAQKNPEYQPIFDTKRLTAFWHQTLMVYHTIHRGILSLAYAQAMWMIYFWIFQPGRNPKGAGSDWNFLFLSFLVLMGTSIAIVVKGSQKQEQQ